MCQVPEQLLVVIRKVKRLGQLSPRISSAGNVGQRQAVEDALRREDRVGRKIPGPRLLFQQGKGEGIDSRADVGNFCIRTGLA
jgi:hypothetical protein